MAPFFRARASAGSGTGANCCRQLITWIVSTLAQAACFLGRGRQGWEKSARPAVCRILKEAGVKGCHLLSLFYTSLTLSPLPDYSLLSCIIAPLPILFPPQLTLVPMNRAPGRTGLGRGEMVTWKKLRIETREAWDQLKLFH